MVRLPTLNTQFLSKKHECLFLLNSCGSMDQLRQIQAQIHLSGLYQDAHTLSELVYFCSLSPSKNLRHARALVHHAATSSPISWNILIRGYAVSDYPLEAFWVFRKMRERGAMPNKLTFPFLIKSCAVASALGEGKQVHADAFKCGLDSDVYVGNNLINFYGRCKKIVDARKVFDELPERTVVSWNSVITACVESLWLDEGIVYFFRMWGCGFEPDETSMVLLLSACAELGYLSLGRWAHSQLVLRGMILSVQLGTALVDMYGKSGALGCARSVFERMKKRNVWTWSAMILGLAQHGFAEKALALFSMMSSNNNHDICPNYVTYLGVLSACSHAGMVDEGYQYFHDMECVHGIKPMMMHYGVMVDVLGRAGRLEEAYGFIQRMPIEPDPIVWRTLLSACTVHDVHDHAGIGERVRKRLLWMEPRRGGNLVIVANMYAEVGMWEKAANVRRVMRDGGMKKMAGESCVDLGGSMHRFFAGYDPCPDLMPVYHLLDGLNLHLKMPLNSSIKRRYFFCFPAAKISMRVSTVHFPDPKESENLNSTNLRHAHRNSSGITGTASSRYFPMQFGGPAASSKGGSQKSSWSEVTEPSSISKKRHQSKSNSKFNLSEVSHGHSTAISSISPENSHEGNLAGTTLLVRTGLRMKL